MVILLSDRDGSGASVTGSVGASVEVYVAVARRGSTMLSTRVPSNTTRNFNFFMMILPWLMLNVKGTAKDRMDRMDHKQRS